MSAAAFRALLEEGDVDGLCSAWGKLFPGMPLPETRDQAEIVMHRARTEAESVSLKARAWSHRWLTERGLPSGLPDQLRPLAERMYPVIAQAVGISVNFSAGWMKPAAAQIERAMGDAVEEAFAEGQREPAFVSARMHEARVRTEKALFGDIRKAL